MMSAEFFSLDGEIAWGLIVDTSSVNGCLIAISPNGTPLKELYWNEDSRHSEVLLSKFLSISKELGKKNLKHLFFINGPGSFTGLRVGAAFVKALSFSLGKLPISTRTSFFPTANQIIKENPTLEEFSVLIPSIRTKVFSAQFLKKDRCWTESVNLDGAFENISSLKNPFSGFKKLINGNDLIKEVTTSTKVLVESFISQKNITAHRTQQTYLDLYPLYLRQSEAEEKNRYDKIKLQQIQKK